MTTCALCGIVTSLAAGPDTRQFVIDWKFTVHKDILGLAVTRKLQKSPAKYW
jgi:hypothetical protein